MSSCDTLKTSFSLIEEADKIAIFQPINCGTSVKTANLYNEYTVSIGLLTSIIDYLNYCLEGPC